MTETVTQDSGEITTEELSAVFDQPGAVQARTPVEEAGHALVDYVAKLKDAAFLSGGDARLQQLADALEDALVREEASRISTPRLAEVTGNIEERELAARYMESKARGARAIGEKHANLRDVYDIVASTYMATAADLRANLHLPTVHIAGKVIPYNQDDSTGLRHADALRTFFTDVHARNVKAGWWHDLETSLPKKRSVGEIMVLMVTEMTEAYDAYLTAERDDKLPQHPGFGVELADLFIRGADLAGAALAGNLVEHTGVYNPGDIAFQRICEIAREYEGIRKTPAALGVEEHGEFLPAMDIAAMTDDKLIFNATRPDHKIENRLKEDGKKT